MTRPDSNKTGTVPRSPTRNEKPQEEEIPNTCDICGQKMEREPESGEYYCPDCYYSEQQ